MQIYTGIDWSEAKHDVVVVNETGAIVAQLVIPHTPQGFSRLEQLHQQLGVNPSECVIGLETAHNLLIDFLWARQYQRVYVIPPNVTRSSRGRYRQSGARSDQSDAYVLADLLRTDQHRLQPWQPDLLLTQQMRAKVSLHLHLTQIIVRWSNRLRAILLRYYPAAVEVFSQLSNPLALTFIQSYPTPAAAARLSYPEFEQFARQHGHRQPGKLPACFARLQASWPQAAAEIVTTYQDEAVLLAKLLLQTVEAKKQISRELKRLLDQHPDQAIFRSLPRVGDFLAAALLIKFGDDRRRFPTPATVQALAGTCPVTDWSGKRRIVKFRQACDRQFRHVVQQWARLSLAKSVWANAYYQQVRSRCRSDNHAYRCLANRWLAIVWKLWQTRQAYDETYHLQQKKARSKLHA